jgi:hypothetical protein
LVARLFHEPFKQFRAGNVALIKTYRDFAVDAKTLEPPSIAHKRSRFSFRGPEFGNKFADMPQSPGTTNRRTRPGAASASSTQNWDNPQSANEELSATAT